MSKENKGLRTFAKHFVNPILHNAALSSRGPFALLRHVGRKSGKTYEIPIMVWRVEDGFIIVLTYGRYVDWLRNLQAAEQGTLRWHKREYVFQTPVFVDAKTALPALPAFIKFVLGLQGAHEYVKLADPNSLRQPEREEKMLQDRKQRFQLPSRLRLFNKYVTNRLLRAFVNLSLGPFAVLRHVGRRSGKPYETVIWVWLLGEGFVIALTYGHEVDWYRNLLAAGGEVLWHKRVYDVGKPEPIALEAALPAFPALFRPLFRKAGMHFVWMKSSDPKPVKV